MGLGQFRQELLCHLDRKVQKYPCPKRQIKDNHHILISERKSQQNNSCPSRKKDPKLCHRGILTTILSLQIGFPTEQCHRFVLHPNHSRNAEGWDPSHLPLSRFSGSSAAREGRQRQGSKSPTDLPPFQAVLKRSSAIGI